MSRVEFRLSMPNRASWDGRWSGEGRNYVIVRSLSMKDVDELLPDGKPHSWFHRWDDGWGAQITARLMAAGERAPKSDGFAGYDWMVDNIIRYGSPYTTGTADGMAPGTSR